MRRCHFLVIDEVSCEECRCGNIEEIYSWACLSKEFVEWYQGTNHQLQPPGRKTYTGRDLSSSNERVINHG
jgi:hypothetical protein